METGRIQITPDFLEEDSENIPTVTRFRTGRPTSSEADSNIYAIYQTAVEKAFGGKGKLKIYYLSTGHTEEVNMTKRKVATRQGYYEAAMKGILAGQFPPSADDWTCPRCPHYFICPAGEDV